MEFFLEISVGIVLGCILGQKELEQLYREYKESRKEEEM